MFTCQKFCHVPEFTVYTCEHSLIIRWTIFSGHSGRFSSGTKEISSYEPDLSDSSDELNK